MKLAIIADDFTGGSDAASFLKRKGAKIVLVTKIPKIQIKCDCLIFALKIRSETKENALNTVKRVCDYLKQYPPEHLYFKYCSTFDSTPKGNIGPVLDFLLDYYNLNHCIICPSLPENGRTVENGILYVNGVKLSESSLKNHPLNPMWDSYIPNLMKPQSKYPCIVINRNMYNTLSNKVSNINKYYIIPDYVNKDDAKQISAQFNNDFLLSGGSGLLEYLFKFDKYQNSLIPTEEHQKTIILCGSCSQTTKSQIQTWINAGKPVFPINPNCNIKKLYPHIINDNNEILFYSDAIFKDLSNLKRNEGFYHNAKNVEKILSNLAVYAYKNNYKRIIVAGGETSGAITNALGFESFYVGNEIAPGVPVLIPTLQADFKLILKSGNFGDKNFFFKALEAKS